MVSKKKEGPMTELKWGFSLGPTFGEMKKKFLGFILAQHFFEPYSVH